MAGSGLAPVTLRRQDLGAEAAHTMFGSPKGGPSVPNDHFRSAVPLGKELFYDFSGPTPSVFTLELSGARPGDSLLVSVPYGSGQPHVYRDWWIDPRNEVRSYPSLAELRSAPGTGYHLAEGVRLYLKLEVDPRRGERDWAHLTVCGRAGC